MPSSALWQAKPSLLLAKPGPVLAGVEVVHSGSRDKGLRRQTVLRAPIEAKRLFSELANPPSGPPDPGKRTAAPDAKRDGGNKREKLNDDTASDSAAELKLQGAISLGRLFSRRRDPEPVLLLVEQARERDAAARLRLLKGLGYVEPEADFATCIRTAELSRHRRRARR
jgi:hypothetical protein